jgi:hypothetical integral membrane protein (TIGR02206 family)
MTAPFTVGCPSHLIVLALTFGVPLLLAVWHGSRVQILVRGFFTALLIGAETLWLWLIVHKGWMSAQTLLPMQLCDWAMVASVITLIRPNPKSYELAYFWALCGSLQALLTPDLAFDFPDLRFVVFFALHGGVIASVLYLTLGMRLRPVPASIPRVIGWTFLYVLAASAANAMFGTNFGFLAAKPAHLSLLSYLAPWPFYILELVPIALLLIVVFYVPFFLLDRLRRRAIVSAPMKR